MKNIKKMLSLALILMMVVSTMVIVPLTANAAYDNLQVDNSVSGKTVYLISSADDLMQISNTSISADVCFKLTADIDMTGKEYKSCKMTGILEFDGNNKKISNLTVTTGRSSNAAGGLFCQLQKASVIKDLTLENVSIETLKKDSTTIRSTGGIVGIATGGLTMTNCKVTGTVTQKGLSNMESTSTSKYCVGGLVGICSQENGPKEYVFTDCTNEAAVNGLSCMNPIAGGIVGRLDGDESTYTMTNCKNTGAIVTTSVLGAASATPMAGSLYGSIHESAVANATFTGCVAGGTVNGAPVATVTAPTEFLIRLKLTDDFGMMVVAEGATGFVFTTDATADVATLAKVEGTAYNGSATAKYAIYDDLSAAALNTTVYFAAYVVDGEDTVFGELRAINPYEVAADLADGYVGDASTGTLVTENGAEKNLYAAMVSYCDKYSAYLSSVTPA